MQASELEINAPIWVSWRSAPAKQRSFLSMCKTSQDADTCKSLSAAVGMDLSGQNGLGPLQQITQRTCKGKPQQTMVMMWRAWAPSQKPLSATLSLSSYIVAGPCWEPSAYSCLVSLL